MVTVILVTIVFAVLLNVVVVGWIFGDSTTDNSIAVGMLFGLILGIAGAVWLGTRVPYKQVVEKQPLVSIYMNQDQNEIYIKTIKGSDLLYRVMENGVPREYTVSASEVTSVVTEDVSPYYEATEYLFGQKWYKYFAFSDKRDILIFHVPQTGQDIDVNSFFR